MGSSIRVVFWPHPLFKDSIEPNVPINVPINERQVWFLEELKQGKKLKSSDIAKRWSVSEKTAKRDIAFLQANNLIDYTGSLKTGYYKVKEK